MLVCSTSEVVSLLINTDNQRTCEAKALDYGAVLKTLCDVVIAEGIAINLALPCEGSLFFRVSFVMLFIV